MYRILFIAAYFGKFPEYFDAWLLSAAFNSTVDFLIVTDQPMEQNLPPNVKLQRTTLSRLRDEIQRHFSFPIELSKPYKLCDFRPAFGIVFQNEISGYDFWGHCDLDQVFGNIRYYLTDEVLEKHGVIGYLGHGTLYKNTEEINSLFRLDGGLFDYQRVFSSKENYAFDEVSGMMRIVKKHGILHKYGLPIADCSTRVRRLKLPGKDVEKQIFFWDRGNLLRAFIKDGAVREEEFYYLHFSGKKPDIIWDKGEMPDSFYIYGGHFSKRNPRIPTAGEIERAAQKQKKLLEKAETVSFYMKKCCKFAKAGRVQKEIWIKQKKAGKNK